MTDHPPLRWRDLPAALLKNRWIQLLVVVLVLIELYNLAVIPAVLTTQKGIETKAVAENAALTKKAEAEIAEWKALNETEIATNAARKQRADARKAKADAQKSQAEAITAREVARNSELKARAEAEAQQAEAELKIQLTLVETEVAKQAARRQKVEADTATEEAFSARYGNMIMQQNMR